MLYANAMGQKIAVVLSGCGFKDGAEVTEAVSSLIALGQQGLDYKCFAPELKVRAVNHIDDSAQAERCLRQEATRITRVEAQPLSQLEAQNFAALVLPGGFGVAKHLCNFAQEGAKASVQPTIKNIIEQFYKAEKPILALCIAPALVACVLGSKGVALTIGRDTATAEQIQATGARHIECDVNDFVSDREHRIISSPAYMYGEARPAQVFEGIQKAVQELAGMA